MADNKTLHPVIFNDDYTHDGTFKRDQYAELNDEQYECAKKLGVSWDQSKPLITDTEKVVDLTAEAGRHNKSAVNTITSPAKS